MTALQRKRESERPMLRVDKVQARELSALPPTLAPEVSLLLLLLLTSLGDGTWPSNLTSSWKATPWRVVH